MTNLTTCTGSTTSLPSSQVQKREELGLFYNQPEPAIICNKQCSFAINPKRTSQHPGDKHDVVKPARRGHKPLICLLSLPDPDGLSLRLDGSSLYSHLAIQRGSACHGGVGGRHAFRPEDRRRGGCS